MVNSVITWFAVVTVLIASRCVRRAVCDVTGTDPRIGSCVCVTSSDSIYDTACGDVLGQVDADQCFRYAGTKQSCSLQKYSDILEFFEVHHPNKTVFVAGTSLISADDILCGCSAAWQVQRGVQYAASSGSVTSLAATAHTATLDACKLKCSSDVTCRGFDWVDDVTATAGKGGESTRCRLDGLGAEWTVTEGQGVDHYRYIKALQDCMPAGCKPTLEYVENLLVTPGIKRSEASTLEDCKQLCINYVHCDGIDWWGQNNECWLNNGLMTVRKTVPDMPKAVIAHYDLVRPASARCVPTEKSLQMKRPAAHAAAAAAAAAAAIKAASVSTPRPWEPAPAEVELWTPHVALPSVRTRRPPEDKVAVFRADKPTSVASPEEADSNLATAGRRNGNLLNLTNSSDTTLSTQLTSTVDAAVGCSGGIYCLEFWLSLPGLLIITVLLAIISVIIITIVASRRATEMNKSRILFQSPAPIQSLTDTSPLLASINNNSAVGFEWFNDGPQFPPGAGYSYYQLQ